MKKIRKFLAAVWAFIFAPAAFSAVLCNDGNIQIHDDGCVTRTTDAALGRYRLVKVGTTPLSSVAVAGASDTPIGVTLDETSNTTDLTVVRLLNGAKGSVRMISDGSAAIAVGDQLVPAASGACKTIAAGAGNYIIVGVALTSVAISATGDDAILEVMPALSWRTK